MAKELKAVIIGEDGESFGEITLKPRDFSTGSRGYQGVGPVVVYGEASQVNFMLTVKGSKLEEGAEARAAAVVAAQKAKAKLQASKMQATLDSIKEKAALKGIEIDLTPLPKQPTKSK